ncbi:MAG TPA: lmo0937 family membrane protein [Anaerolineales bacterium]|nr:lmo0937 family membrane protein [Anaerolineales bacterium]
MLETIIVVLLILWLLGLLGPISFRFAGSWIHLLLVIILILVIIRLL